MPFRNRKAFSKTVQKDVVQDLKSRKGEFEAEGTKNIQDAVEYLKVVDTRNLKANSRMKMFSFGDSIVWRFETTNVPYAIFPRNGLGSSRAYGARKYDVLGAVRTLKAFGVKKKINENTGRPRPSKIR